ncbi:hypothetical protein ON010_g4175 [Phytophthora cinnamomi]|nr:hypothetical protein ON010_g4175 [Phytophthora cinnamomi]
MGLTDVSNNSVEYLHHVLAHIQKLSTQACGEGNATYIEPNVVEKRIGICQRAASNAAGRLTFGPRSVSLVVVREQVARLAKVARQFVRGSAGQARSTQHAAAKTRLHAARNSSYEENQRVVAVTRKVSKQIQTQEQDDQWEWQRVWKGAFDKMHMQLQQKTEETEALATENKELQSVVAGYKKALEEVERAQRDVEAKHLAEIENLRAVHSLELSNLQARHRQKLQEATLQNDEKLLSRRRESHFIRPATATTRQEEQQRKRIMSTKTLQGDPRRPGDLHPFVREQVDPDEAPGDWYAFFSLVLGFLAFTMKGPLMLNFCWLMLCLTVEGAGVGLAAAVRGLVHQHEVAGHEHNAGGHVLLLLHERTRVRLHGHYASRHAHAPVGPVSPSPGPVDGSGGENRKVYPRREQTQACGVK